VTNSTYEKITFLNICKKQQMYEKITFLNICKKQQMFSFVEKLIIKMQCYSRVAQVFRTIATQKKKSTIGP